MILRANRAVAGHTSSSRLSSQIWLSTALAACMESFSDGVIVNWWCLLRMSWTFTRSVNKTFDFIGTAIYRFNCIELKLRSMHFFVVTVANVEKFTYLWVSISGKDDEKANSVELIMYKFESKVNEKKWLKVLGVKCYRTVNSFSTF